jgi:hypothetical protein
MDRACGIRVSLAMLVAVLAVVILVAPGFSAGGLCAEADRPPVVTTPMNVFVDEGKFALYVNEEVLVRGEFQWRSDGSYTGNYTLSMAGQSIDVSLDIKVAASGQWTSMSMASPQGPVEIIREGNQAKITAAGQTQTVELREGTRVFENFSPALMSQAVATYNQAAGGKQTFPLLSATLAAGSRPSPGTPTACRAWT